MNIREPFMRFPEPRVKVKFLRRPQRFLAEVSFADGSKTRAYCANPGSFNGCLKNGSAAVLWDSADTQRKRRYTLRAVKLGRVWIGTDTHLANRLVERALQQQLLPTLKGYPTLERERPSGKGQRIDFLLSGAKGSCFLEVKSATVVAEGVARFPDSVTPRGLKHLNCLTQHAKQGHRAVILFVVQRGDATCFTVSSARHPAYAKAFQRALRSGVEALAFAVAVTPKAFGKPIFLPFAATAENRETTGRDVF
jgi:sugar fermentation stimulation protein A